MGDDEVEVAWPRRPATTIEVPDSPRNTFDADQAIKQFIDEDTRIDEQLQQCSDRFDEVVELLHDLSGTNTTVEKVLHLVENLRLLVGFYKTFTKDAQALESTKQKWLELADQDYKGAFEYELVAKLKRFEGRSFRCTTQHPASKLQPRLDQQCKNLNRFLNHAQKTWLKGEKRNLGFLEHISSPIGSPLPENEQAVVQSVPDDSADDVLLLRGGNITESVATKVQQFLGTINEDEDLVIETNEIFDDASAPRDSNYLDTRRAQLINRLKGIETNSDESDDSSDISSTMEETEEEIAQREKTMEERETVKLQDESSRETDAGLAEDYAMANGGAEQENVGNVLADAPTAVATPVPASPPPKQILEGYYRDLLSGSLIKIQAPRQRKTVRARIARERTEKEEKERAERERAAAQEPSSPVQETVPRLVLPAVVAPAVVVPTWHRVLSFFGLVSVVPAVERVGGVLCRQPKRAREVEGGESEDGGRQKRRRLNYNSGRMNEDQKTP